MEYEVRFKPEELELLRDSVTAEWKREHDRIEEGIARLHALYDLQMKLTEALLKEKGKGGR